MLCLPVVWGSLHSKARVEVIITEPLQFCSALKSSPYCGRLLWRCPRKKWNMFKASFWGGRGPHLVRSYSKSSESWWENILGDLLQATSTRDHLLEAAAQKEVEAHKQVEAYEDVGLGVHQVCVRHALACAFKAWNLTCHELCKHHCTHARINLTRRPVTKGQNESTHAHCFELLTWHAAIFSKGTLFEV